MTPRSEAEFERVRTESRDKIIRAALELFAKNGFTNTTIEAIAKRAGVAKGLIYNYFTTKEELLYHSCLNFFDDFERAFAEFQAEKDPVRLLELFIDGMFEMFGNQIDMWRLQMGIFMNPEIPERMRETVLQKIGEYCAFINGVFTRCGVSDAESESWIFAATLDGVMLYYLFWGNRMPLDSCRKTLKRKYRALLEGSYRKDAE